MKYFYRHKTYFELYYIDIRKDGKTFLKSLVRKLKNIRNIENEDSEDEDGEENIEPRKACFILISNCTSQDMIDVNIYSILDSNSSFIIIYDKEKKNNEEQNGLLKESILVEEDNIHISSNKNVELEKNNQDISLRDFDILKLIGKGNFSNVYEVRYKSNGNIYALKLYDKTKINEKNEIDYYREKEILYDLTNKNNPNIVKLYADFEDNNYRCLVMEYVEGSTLKNFRKDNNIKGYVPQKEVINILTQILKTLEFLHDKCHIIHRDINPNNIIIQKDGNIKLIDFGISAYLENSNKKLVSNKSFKGRVNYVAPEILLFPPPRNYDYKIDIFSLGFTMYNFMNPSDKGIDNLPQITNCNGGNFSRIDQYLENNEYEFWLNDFIDHLSEDDQNQRKTAKEALDLLDECQKNPKIKQIFNDLESKKSNLENINVLFKRDDYYIDPNLDNLVLRGKKISNIIIPETSKINEPKSIYSDLNKKGAEIYLGPYIIQDNKNNEILTSMKSLLQILFQLDIIQTIKAQLLILVQNNPNAYNQYNNLFIISFIDILNKIQQYQNGQINQASYDQIINDFINKVFINNNSGISGVRPIVLLYIITFIFKNEFLKYFNSFENNICYNFIQTNFFELNYIFPVMYNINTFNEVKKNILYFKNNYKGPFVDNFYFIILIISSCPNCNNIYNTRAQVAQFLQLNVKNRQNNIYDLIIDYFKPKISIETFYCGKCGLKVNKSKRIYCLTLPNYLILELEDKNSVNFNNNIILPLFNGNMCSYQYASGIYKFRNEDVSEFVSVIKKENTYDFFSDDKIEKCSKEFINLECPSLVIYKKD